VLQNPYGHLGLLAGLMNQELHAETPSDVVVFLGPATRYGAEVPQAALEDSHGAVHSSLTSSSGLTFAISSNCPTALSRPRPKVKGKTIIIRTPADFAKAIEQIERRGPRSPAVNAVRCRPRGFV